MGSGEPGSGAALMRWYEPRRSLYPWRRQPADAYRTLVSEVMLQQTQAARVAPAFERFVGAFADVRALASAPRADVLRAWEGLGYNRRAVALSEAARTIVRERGGEVPSDPAVLQTLPGVGPYTAAAVASIGYGAVLPAIDVNVRRVVARSACGVEPADAGHGSIGAAAAAMIDRDRPGDWNQAVMDLGREVCRSRPRCEVCPVAAWCAWRTVDGTSRGSAARITRRQGRFDGSFRQVRGGVVRELRRGQSDEADLARALSRPIDDVRRAIEVLTAEGAVERSRGGAVRLAESGRSRSP